MQWIKRLELWKWFGYTPRQHMGHDDDLRALWRVGEGAVSVPGGRAAGSLRVPHTRRGILQNGWLLDWVCPHTPHCPNRRGCEQQQAIQAFKERC